MEQLDMPQVAPELTFDLEGVGFETELPDISVSAPSSAEIPAAGIPSMIPSMTDIQKLMQEATK